jgi:hypothetical protein
VLVPNLIISVSGPHFTADRGKWDWIRMASIMYFAICVCTQRVLFPQLLQYKEQGKKEETLTEKMES